MRLKFRSKRAIGFIALLSIVALLIAAACGNGDASSSEELSGTIEIDGSSTVAPVSQAAAEDFQILNPKVNVIVGITGTGGGFKRFTAGETDISDASRPIRDEEAQQAADNGIEYIALKVGTDGLSVIVNLDNDFVECLTTEELKLIWEPGSSVDSWNDIRPEWPDDRIGLYGPDTDSGTFDYFTEEIMGEAQLSRSDYTASADDNTLVRGVSGDRNALGYFGYSYYIENADKLKLVAVDSGDGCVLPSSEAIELGEYTPLSRPLFIYVNTESLKRPEVKAFVQYYMEEARRLVSEVGYVPESDQAYQDNLNAVQ